MRTHLLQVPILPEQPHHRILPLLDLVVKLLAAVTVVLLAAVVYLLIKKIVRHPLGICACCLILSGGIGNIIDRLRLGYVVDMLHFQFWPSYPTFNVADVCIVSGAILGAIYYVLLYEKHDRRKTDGASDPANGQ